MIGTLMIAGLCLALGCILGYAYRPVHIPKGFNEDVDALLEAMKKHWLPEQRWWSERDSSYSISKINMNPVLDAWRKVIGYGQ